MLEYNDIKMELVNIDRFEREAMMSQDGVNHLWNQYTIQVTAVVHFAYLDLEDELGQFGPFVTNKIIKEKLMEKRKKFKMSFFTGGFDESSNTLGGATFPFGATVDPTDPFTYNGPVSSDLFNQVDVVPDLIDNANFSASQGAEEILIESPLIGAEVDAHLGPEPQFCHITRFLGNNGFVITWCIRTWLVECPDKPLTNISALLNNRFVMMHDIDQDQITTVTTYGEAVFRTDLLLFRGQTPDMFRNQILAPIYRGFRRQHIQVKQMSDTTVNYMTSDVQTPVIFDPSVDNVVRAEILHRRVLAQIMPFSSALIGGVSEYYNFRANQNWATNDRQNQNRADELHKAQMENLKMRNQNQGARAANLQMQQQNMRMQQHQNLTGAGRKP